MAYIPWVNITDLSISYPDFQWGAVANPDEIDINNSEIVSKLNSISSILNAKFTSTELPFLDSSVTTRLLRNESINNSKIALNADIAQSKINNISGWISTGIQTANTSSAQALTNSSEALSTANNANTNASSALSISDGALTIANTANSTANDAFTDANLALITSNALTTDYNAKLPEINAGIESIALKVDKSYVDALIADLTIGAMPDGSVDDAKLSNAPWQIKDRLAKLSLMKTAGNYSTTTFEADGSIVIRIYNSANTLLNTATTTFPANGSIITTTVWSDNYTSVETTVFNIDGSITTTVTSG